MSKQSSIDWLVEQIKKDINLRLRGFDIDKALEQAKAMHNKEIVDAHVNGNKEYTIGGGYELIAEHYYNETFGGQEEPKPIHQQIIDAVGGEDRFRKICKIEPKQETFGGQDNE